MTILMIKKDWYPHQSMRTPFGEGMESTLDIEATRIPQLKNKNNLGRMEEAQLRKLRIDLADVENDWIHLKRSTPVGKELT